MTGQTASGALRALKPQRTSTVKAGTLWYVPHIAQPALLQLFRAPSVAYASPDPAFRGDYAVFLTGQTGRVKAYAVWAEAGEFMYVTHLAATSKTGATAVLAELARLAGVHEYLFLFLEGAAGGSVPPELRDQLRKLRFGDRQGYGLIGKDAYRQAEAELIRKRRETGMKTLPSPQFETAYQNTLDRHLSARAVPTRFAENSRTSSTAGAGTSTTNSGSSNNNSNRGVTSRQRPMLLTVGR